MDVLTAILLNGERLKERKKERKEVREIGKYQVEYVVKRIKKRSPTLHASSRHMRLLPPRYLQ